MPPLSRHPAAQLGALIGKWPIALVACFVLAATILLPCLGEPGLWEPSERQLSDRLAPPLDVDPKAPSPSAPPPKAGKSGDEDCLRVAPKDAAARTLSAKAIEFGRDSFGDSDGGRRLPFALLGLVTALAAAGLAMRGGGGRAGIVTLCVLLAMPVMVMQARMVTSDIGTACGATLILYGLFGLARPNRSWLAFDLVMSVIALVCGVPLAFYAGGALLGLLVPIGAFAAAGSMGVPLVVDAINRRSVIGHVPAVIAAVATIVIASVLVYQLYYLVEPYPGLTPPPARQMFGQAIVAEGCWSSALGAIWRPEDDVRFIFDSTFEQIAYGTFPWGILGPIAMFG
nr:glycosyltransferase family 39 protein [Deltaproteobacteria bacterium]